MCEYTLRHDRHVLKEQILMRQRRKAILIPDITVALMKHKLTWADRDARAALSRVMAEKKGSKFCYSCCFCFSFQITFHRNYNTCWDNKSQGLFPNCLRGCLSRESGCECVFDLLTGRQTGALYCVCEYPRPQGRVKRWRRGVCECVWLRDMDLSQEASALSWCYHGDQLLNTSHCMFVYLEGPGRLALFWCLIPLVSHSTHTHMNVVCSCSFTPLNTSNPPGWLIQGQLRIFRWSQHEKKASR